MAGTMLVLILVLVLSLVYLTVNVTKLLVHNRRAHKFFASKSPQLPLIPYPNCLLGNIDHTLWKVKSYQQLEQWHQKLGRTYGYYFSAQPWVSTTDIDLIKKIELDEAHKHVDRPFFNFFSHEINTSILQINGDKWRRVRRAIGPVLSNHNVRSDEVSADIERIIGLFIVSLDRKVDRAEASTGKASVILSTHEQLQRLTLALIFSMFYKKENVIDFDAEVDDWTEIITRAEREIQSQAVRMTWALPFLRPLFRWALNLHPLGRMNRRIVAYINETVNLRQIVNDKRMPSVSEDRSVPKRTLVDGILDALMDGTIDRELFVGSSFFLLLAGFETTASTAACLLWHLAQNVDIQTKLREAIINEGVDADYVVWCIMETVRWLPAAPLGTGRVLADDVTTNDGLLIPKGTYVMPSVHSIHHDESIWPEHNRFLPERWRDRSNFHSAAFVGFGLGPRNCPGGKLAVHEIKLIMKAILTRYKVERCLDTPAEYEFVTPGWIFTIPARPVLLQFTRIRGMGL